MKKYKKLLFSITFIAIVILFGTITSNASSDNLYLNNLEFMAQINSDGSMDVTEMWDINISDTNTLYKTFKTDSSKYSGIENVEVAEIKDGVQDDLYLADSWSYHMSKDYYYGGENSDGIFEICWGVGLEDEEATRQYTISYTVEDAITKYSDYAELYWQFVGSDFEIDAAKIKGTILLPSDADSKEEIKVWGHTENLNGEIYATDYDKIEFNIDKFRSGRYVEIRTLFPTDMIYYAKRYRNTNILQKVIDEETKWAEEANARRERQENVRRISKWIILIVEGAIDILLIVLFVKKIKKIKNIEKIQPSQNIEYYREIPREKEVTPAEALYLYKNNTNSFSSKEIGRIFSSTLLDLNLKKIIDFEIENPNSKKEIITIKLIKYSSENLDGTGDEKIIFNFLKKACGDYGKITVKELQKYIKNHGTEIEKLKLNLENASKNKLEKKEIIDSERKREYDEAIAGAGIYLSIGFTLLCLLIPLSFGCVGNEMLIPSVIISLAFIINVITSIILARKINVFTQKGVDEHEQWKGLKKYMEDFSLLKEKEIPEIVLWEKFLVFATVFGIEKKVLKQLKIVYPDFENDVNVNTYACMHLMMDTDFSSNFSDSISSAVSSTYSSSSGSGGGFSGGGGGGRRPEVAVEEDNSETHTKVYNIKRTDKNYGK